MTVAANTHQTYQVTNIKEDMADLVDLIDPTDTPFMTAIGRGKKLGQPHFEWNTIALASANPNNKVVEGDEATNDAPNLATRLGNYTQIMDKVAEVSHSAEESDAAGRTQTMKEQLIYKAKELKTDMEARLLSDLPAAAGNASTARETAGFGCFLRTNVSRGDTGTNPTLSSGTSGYPNAAPGAGTPRDFTEALLKTVIQSAWDAGGKPSKLFMNSYNKLRFSAFSGNATRYKEADRTLSAAIDVYESDFGKFSAVPSHFMDEAGTDTSVYVLDPSKARIRYLRTMRNEALAKVGHSDRRMISVEWGFHVDNEKAHGVVADVHAESYA